MKPGLMKPGLMKPSLMKPSLMTPGLALAAATALLAGCAQPPVLSLAGRACDKAPRLTSDNQVSLGAGRGSTVALDAASPCLDTPAGPATYAVFALPAATTPYRITVRSRPRWHAILSPQATIYGADDHPRRDLGGFRAEAGTLVASATGEPGDRYLVVTSTPATIGTSQTLPTAANPPPVRLAATVVIPIIIPATPTGPVTDAFSITLAHSGTVAVSAAPFMTVP